MAPVLNWRAGEQLLFLAQAAAGRSTSRPPAMPQLWALGEHTNTATGVLHNAPGGVATMWTAYFYLHQGLSFFLLEL